MIMPWDHGYRDWDEDSNLNLRGRALRKNTKSPVGPFTANINIYRFVHIVANTIVRFIMKNVIPRFGNSKICHG